MTVMTETITYEQPLNESMRIYLRLEHLFNQLKIHTDQADSLNSRLAISALAKVLDVIHRPDFKSKLTQTLTQFATTLAQLEQFPQVDPVRLKSILSQLDKLIISFHHQKNRIGDQLRQNEFINQIRLRQGNPGGICNYLIPAYSLWLQKPAHERIADIKIWSSEFSELHHMVDLILYLIRNSSEHQNVTAYQGFYQQNLNPSLPCEMIRIHVPMDYRVFPEFSAGRHRLAIRFLAPNYIDNGRPNPTTEDIEFELSCCRV